MYYSTDDAYCAVCVFFLLVCFIAISTYYIFNKNYFGRKSRNACSNLYTWIVTIVVKWNTEKNVSKLYSQNVISCYHLQSCFQIFDNMENAHDKIQKNQCIIYTHRHIYTHTYIYDSLNIIKIREEMHTCTPLWKKNVYKCLLTICVEPFVYFDFLPKIFFYFQPFV